MSAAGGRHRQDVAGKKTTPPNLHSSRASVDNQEGGGTQGKQVLSSSLSASLLKIAWIGLAGGAMGRGRDPHIASTETQENRMHPAVLAFED
mmetsp:Transcript_50864/g.142352  ORF Transcript_50864/g.142352 Transcript_50864/m.142352 type:complete len:92 (-) Transcript_50864:10-285(-)